MIGTLRALAARRPGWANALLVFCAYMTLVYVPWDLFWKPVARDEEVWFGIVFHGWAAKLLAVPHWLVYGAGMVGFWGMRRWMWPWAAVYAAQVTFGMVLWPLLYVGGWAALLSAVVGGGFFALVTWTLWRARPLFQPEAAGLRERYGRWALVTGASSGIGRAFAEALARRGLDLVLTARRGERLEELAQTLRQRDGVETRVIPHDLGRAGAAEELAAAVADLELGVLVNNAGFGAFGPMTSLPAARVREMVELNCVAPAVLAHALLPAMTARGRGAVVFVGSVAGMLPVPHHALYGATKAFDNALGEALHEELRAGGIDVLALAPGSTETEFHGRAGERSHAGADPVAVVESALDALGRQPLRVPILGDWLQANLALRLLPRSLLVAVVGGAVANRAPDPQPGGGAGSAS